MAIDIWKGPNGTAGAPTSGDFIVAANWSTGGVPDRSVNVALAPGDYTVTLTDAGAEVGSLTIGAGATLALSDITTPAGLSMYDDSVNGGTISLSGSAIGLPDSVSLTNFGALTFAVANGYVSQIGGGTLVNEGLMTQGAAGGYGLIFSALLNDAAGLVSSAMNGAIILAGVTTNIGRIEALSNSTVTTTGFGHTGTVTNLSGGVLSGGAWAARGTGATLEIADATISVLDGGATVTLDGVGSSFRLDGGGNPVYLEQTLDTVGAGATLEVLGGRDWSSSENLTVRGALHLGGGVFAPGDLRIEKGAAISGFGTVASQAIVDGLMKVDGGQTLEFATYTDFNSKIVGNGTLALTGGEDTFTTSKVDVKHLLFDGADIQFDQNLKYAGELTVTTGTVELKDSALTLAGQTTIGTATIQGGPGGVLSVTGDLRAHGGTTELDVRTIKVDGVVAVDHGALQVNGAVSGSGSLWIGAQGTLEFEAASRLSGGPLVSMAGPNATLVFDNLNSNGARVAQFDGKDSIDFAALGSAGTKATWRADADGLGGTLKISNGSQTATIHLEENHGKKDFALKGDGHGGTIVTLAKTAAFGLVDASAFGHDAPAGGHLFTPAHEWHGALALALA